MLLNKKIIATVAATTLLFACNEAKQSDKNILSKTTVNQKVTSDKSTSAELGPLHVASPKWQDQIIYFLMIDRFNDGNLHNSDQGVGVYERGAKDKYNGGDLQGVIDKLDYIKQLGATAVWTTPQVANQWWDPVAEFWGYHGYWARDFKSVDEHYGKLEDYQQLAKSLHAKNMYLIQDIVVNHTGNFFYYDGDYDEQNVKQNFKINTGSIPSVSASQFPFTQNDVNKVEHQQANIFNWTPSIIDITVHKQETTYQTSGLDDMNTKNPVVRNALKDSFGYWIKEAGVDAFRIDTAKYVEKEFYEDFLHGDDGIVTTAKSTGRNDFFTFGEIFEMSQPFTDRAEKKITDYLGTDENPRIDAPLSFPLYNEIKQVFAGGRPTSYLSYRVDAAMKWYKDPFRAVNFIDNHDVERFLANGTLSGFKQAYAFMMSIPGIPVIYQGDEQAHLLSRQAMFAGGYGSEQDQFNQASDMFRFIQTLTKIRTQHKVFSRGSIEFIQENASGPGILAYKREYNGKTAYVILNSAEQTALLSRLPTSFYEDNQPTILLAENIDKTLPFAEDGTLTMEMPARSILVLIGNSRASQPTKSMTQEITVAPIPVEFNNVTSAIIQGTTTAPHAELIKIIDGNIEQAEKFSSDAQGKWRTNLPLDGLGNHQHAVEIFWPEKNYVTNKLTYSMNSTIVSGMAAVDDLIGDDKGPAAQYIKPGYQADNCYLDIDSVQARTGGNILELTIKMCDISNAWAPPNGFDHLALTIYFNDKKASGLKALPLLNSAMPQQGTWNVAHSAFGWGNYVFATDGASSTQEGTILNYTPIITVNHQSKEIKMIYHADKLGIDGWLAVDLYLTTWDKDEGGDYRLINETPSKWHFSDSAQNSPKIADDAFMTILRQE